jgi:hypothetical protein
MNSETCSVLASVFPLILITTVLESRAVHFNLRSRRLFRWGIYAGMSTSIVGLALSVIGVNRGGYSAIESLAVWPLFWTALAALALSILGIAATFENEDDDKLAKRAKKDARAKKGS